MIFGVKTEIISGKYLYKIAFIIFGPLAYRKEDLFRKYKGNRTLKV